MSNPFKLVLLGLCWFYSIGLNAQFIQILDTGAKVSFRGLSAVSDQIFWCCGSNGTVVRSTDGGRSLQWIKVKGYERRDFRDIEAFDERSAVIMAIGEPALILRTNDAGNNWQKVFEDTSKGMFLDAMDFDKRGHGVVIGDPLKGHLYRAYSNDFGMSWLQDTLTETMLEGESFFASSGTNIRCGRKAIWVSGGLQSRLYYGKKIIRLPMQQGRQSSGANSIAIYKNRAIVVGGDFTNPQCSDSNCLLIDLRNHSLWERPLQPPNGYKSCVQHLWQSHWMCCGTTGVEFSEDNGKSWSLLSTSAYHVLQPSPNAKVVFLAGPNGKIAKMLWTKK